MAVEATYPQERWRREASIGRQLVRYFPAINVLIALYLFSAPPEFFHNLEFGLCFQFEFSISNDFISLQALMDDIETPKESVCIGEGKCKKCGWIGGGAAGALPTYSASSDLKIKGYLSIISPRALPCFSIAQAIRSTSRCTHSGFRYSRVLRRFSFSDMVGFFIDIFNQN